MGLLPKLLLMSLYGSDNNYAGQLKVDHYLIAAGAAAKYSRAGPHPAPDDIRGACLSQGGPQCGQEAGATSLAAPPSPPYAYPPYWSVELSAEIMLLTQSDFT